MMKKVLTAMKSKILKIRYALSAAVIISLLLTTSITQNANANPGPAVGVTPNIATSGTTVHASFTSFQSFGAVGSPLHHYNFHAHEIAYRDVAPGTFSIDPANFADCETKALSPLSRHIVTEGTNGAAFAAFGGGAVPAGRMVHVTFDNATTDYITLQIDSGASFKLGTSPTGITLYYDSAAGPIPIDPASIPIGLDVHWDNGAGLREDTTGPGTGNVWACTFQDAPDATLDTTLTELNGDPETPPDTYDLTSGTFTKQADNTNVVEILDPQVQPATIKVGDTFAINATLVNNSPNTINVHNGCGGPFSVVFDNHATVDLKKICNWMAIQIILKPGENITGTSLASNLAYRATAPGTANATVTFSYTVGNQTGSNLSFDKNATSISKSFLFTISNETAKTSSMTLSPLKQFKSGIAAKDVKCEQGLQLVIKTEDGSPACIKPNDATMLVQRGWATPV